MISQSSKHSEPDFPNSNEAEAFLLGAMIMDGSCIDAVRKIVQKKHLTNPIHQIIYQALVKMRNTNKIIDLVVLREELVQRNKLKQVGGVCYLVELAEKVPNAKNAENYAKIIRDQANS